MPPSGHASTSGAAVYDFSRPAPLAREHERALRLVFEEVARRVTPVLSSRLRQTTRMVFQELEVIPGPELAVVTSVPALFGFIAWNPLPGSGILHLPLPAARQLVDMLMGGGGGVAHNPAPLSVIERRLAATILQRCLPALGQSWASLLEVRPVLESLLSDPEEVRLKVTSEPALRVRFSLELLDEAHDADLYFEGITMAGIMKVLPEVSPAALDVPAPDPLARAAVADVVRSVPLQVRVVLPETPVSSARVMRLVPGDVLSLDCPTDRPLPMRVGDVTVGSVRPARTGGRLACQVVTVNFDGHAGAGNPGDTNGTPGRVS